jgi:hypothetical protein
VSVRRWHSPSPRSIPVHKFRAVDITLHARKCPSPRRPAPAPPAQGRAPAWP